MRHQPTFAKEDCDANDLDSSTDQLAIIHTLVVIINFDGHGLIWFLFSMLC